MFFDNMFIAFGMAAGAGVTGLIIGAIMTMLGLK